MKDLNMLLNFIQSHAELVKHRPSDEIAPEKVSDPRLQRALKMLQSLLTVRLIRPDNGAPRVKMLSALENDGWNIRPTQLTATGWLGGLVQTRVGRIAFR